MASVHRIAARERSTARSERRRPGRFRRSSPLVNAEIELNRALSRYPTFAASETTRNQIVGTYREITDFIYLNMPVLAGAIVLYRTMDGEINSPELFNRYVDEVLERILIQPDVPTEPQIIARTTTPTITEPERRLRYKETIYRYLRLVDTFEQERQAQLETTIQEFI